MLSRLFLLVSLPVALVSAESGSTFAGSTSTAIYPPPGSTGSADEAYFPDASQVGFPGPTPTGDEAKSLETAPSYAKVVTQFPLIGPDTGDRKGRSFDVLKSWGNLSPFYSVESSLRGASPLIPNGCQINQVHLLHRHGARYPTGGSAPSSFATKLHTAATGAGFSASGPLEFLNTWTYKLGAAILTPFGREQIFELGVGFRVKYGTLLKGFTELPVWRTTSQERMVDSALHFAAGFFGVQSYQTDYNQLVMIESPGINNTLAPYETCANSNNAIGNYGTNQSNVWAANYLRGTLPRVQSWLKGVNLTVSDLVAMQQLCAYETVALGYSSFCELFTEEEWRGFDYFVDLDSWYSDGPGNPTSAAMGKGWVQEVMSRLTRTPIKEADVTTSNYTLVNNSITFPLNSPMYVDATHDSIISAIVTTMNFTSFAANGPLPTDHIPQHQSYIVSHISPFGANLVGQVLSCPASSTPTHIRWILNDAVVPLTGIRGCKSDKNGLCELPAFISGMQQRLAEIDFEFDCFANYTIPIPDDITDGRYPRNGSQ